MVASSAAAAADEGVRLLGVVVGVDIGGTKLAAGLVGEGPQPLATLRTPTPRGADALIDALVALVEGLAAQAPEPIEAVGVGLPSLIDQRARRAVMSVNVDLADLDVVALLEERLQLPVAIDNDANLAALAEHRAGAGLGLANIVLLTIGTGIGGGVIIDGEPFRGSRGTGAELGHMVVQADGPACQGRCPGRGCLETMASGTAIARDARAHAERRPDGALAAAARRDHGELRGPAVMALARQGDADALAVVEGAARHLGAGLASIANIFNPDALIVGGGVGEAGEVLLRPAREEYVRRALPPNAAAPVLQARFGNEAGVVGAALLARQAAG
jgi:glucokinase